MRLLRTFAASALVCLLAAVLLSAPARAQRPEQLPDLDVLYIERTPRYPGYQPDYDVPGLQGVGVLLDAKTRKPLTAAQAKTTKRWPAAGEAVTFTAHVQNRGNAAAPAWEYAWYLDGREVARGATTGPQPVGKEVAVAWRWKWQPGQHFVRFVADPLFKVRDLSLNNNAREDATDAWSLIWAVDRKTYDAFNRLRNFLGTRSFEDWAQWHVDHMNHLFAVSPSPVRRVDGWLPHVRCDRVVVVDDVEGAWDRVLGKGVMPLAAGYDGAWSFGRRDDCTEWAANVDWGLIHEWGHQLGLTDEYALDRPGYLNMVADASGDPLLIAHRSSQAGYMMHGHGPTTFSPECMASLLSQRDRRRGFYGDYYYCLPAMNLLRVLDSRGKPVAGARVDFWQDTDSAYKGKPVFGGVTDVAGLFALPNRPAPAPPPGDYRFRPRPNPFGKVNVVGPGDVFFIRIRARGQTEYAWLDIAEMNLAYWSTGSARAVFTRRTHIPPAGAPPAPSSLKGDVLRGTVKLAWQPVPGAKAYRVYHAAPDLYEWQPVGNVTAPWWAGALGNGALHRYAVAAVMADGRESAFSPVAGAMRFVQPWGIAVTKDGRRYIRDAAYGQAALQKPDGSTVGLVGSVHYHFEGSFDLALDPAGRILSAKLGDGYDPRPGFRVQAPDLSLVVDYRKDEGSAPGQFRQPMGIAANSKGEIFVADTGNDRVQEFTPDGKFVRIIGAGELAAPMKVAFDRQDRMYVADSIHNRIAVYEPQADGGYKLARSIPGPKEPCYVAVDAAGRVFVSTNREAAVLMYGPDGKQAWRYTGTPEEPLASPRGLAFDGKGNLLIVDAASRRVLTVRPPAAQTGRQ